MGILFFVIMMVIVFKMTGFILGIFGRLLGMFLSLMLHVAFGSTAVLLASDAEKPAERLAVKALPNSMLKADVLLSEITVIRTRPARNFSPP